MKRILLAVILLCVCTSAYARLELEPDQYYTLQIAYKYGSQIHYKGDTWGETAAAIVWQETKGGWSKYKRNGVIVGDLDQHGVPKSLGRMQVQIPAARDVERWYPIIFQAKFGEYSPTDEELIIALLTDVDFNIQTGVAYFRKMLELKNGNWSEAILAYNRGSGNDGRDINNYIPMVKKWRKEIVQPFLKGDYIIMFQEKTAYK